MTTPDLRLYVILDPALTRGRPVADIAASAIAGRATILQVRAKGATTRDLVELVDAVQAVASPHGVPVIVNDRADVAFACGASGVHLGPDDLPPAAARRLLGPDALVGCSAGTPDEAIAAALGGADYVGTGDVFGTTSKGDADAPIGLAGFAAVVAVATIPVVAIGGITAANAGQAIAAGAAGVAVIGAVGLAEDPEEAARMIRWAVDEALEAYKPLSVSACGAATFPQLTLEKGCDLVDVGAVLGVSEPEGGAQASGARHRVARQPIASTSGTIRTSSPATAGEDRRAPARREGS